MLRFFLNLPCLFVKTLAFNQGLPSSRLRIVVLYPAVSKTEMMSRNPLDVPKQPVTVEKRPGAGDNTCLALVISRLIAAIC